MASKIIGKEQEQLYLSQAQVKQKSNKLYLILFICFSKNSSSFHQEDSMQMLLLLLLQPRTFAKIFQKKFGNFAEYINIFQGGAMPIMDVCTVYLILIIVCTVNCCDLNKAVTLKTNLYSCGI